MSDRIFANLKTGKLKAFGKVIDISCKVRTEENGLRLLTEEPVRSIPEALPIMPRQFPVGVWEVLEPRKRESKALAPYFIPTTAYRSLPVWSMTRIDGKEQYRNQLMVNTIDRGYGLHYSEYKNTIGCIKIENKEDLVWLVSKIKEEIKERRLMIEVVE